MAGLPTVKAKELLKKYFIKRPEDINIEEIANAEYLIVEDREFEINDGEGSIIHSGDAGIISVSRKVRGTGHRNFIISHEIGHYKLDNIRKRICTKYEISIRKVNGIIEQEANEFAAELLMPEEWYSEETGTIEKDITGIKSGAEKFNVSLTASAIRYSQAGKTPIAVIMSEKGKVKWSSINKHFPFIFIPKGYAVNSYSSANDFYTGKPLNTEPEEIRPEAWFQEDANYKKYRLSREEITFWEQNIDMKKYNSVLTILWLKNIKG